MWEPGQYVKAGDIIGTVGNTGPVYHNGVAVTKEARLAGSHDGAHLHGPQVRPTRRVKVTAGGQLLSDGFGVQSWSRKSAQDDKWSFCLTTAKMAAEQER
jgi:murein DD-endopeptidase MepM/ murein hydrolase activator NlpD